MMKNFKNYFSVNGLVLNETKCSILVCRPGKKVTELKLGEQSEESFVKLLGLYIDSGYNFATHIQKMKSSVLFKISCIKKISCYLSDKNLRTMVESMVLSKISYCGEIYIGKTMEVASSLLHCWDLVIGEAGRFGSSPLSNHDVPDSCQRDIHTLFTFPQTEANAETPCYLCGRIIISGERIK